MSKSLADLRTTKAQSRPERSTTICLAPHLVAEAQSLSAELDAIVEQLASLRPAEGGEQQGPTRSGDGSKRREVEALEQRGDEIRERFGVLLDEIAEHEGEMRIRANLSDGDWRRWCNEHPAREEGEPGHDRDQRVTFGYCNADDLLDDLGPFAHSWNGDPCDAATFAELIEPRTAPGDMLTLAKLVVAMYEGDTADFRHWRTVSQGNLKRLNGSASLATSGSATTDSTAGSPEPSSEDSTQTGTK